MTTVSAPARPGEPIERSRSLRHPLLRPEVPVIAAIVLAALVLAVITHAVHLQALPDLARGSAASLVLFAVCGDALALALLPASWGTLVPLLGVAIGAAASALALTALGLAHVPLHVSLWVVLAAGLVASALVRRRANSSGRSRPQIDRWQLGCWLAVLFVLFCVALMPAWRTGADTIYGTNPDAHQVAGIAVLFQHVPPTGTDVSLPIDTVPGPWRFRYPIFYALAGASNLSHFDPIRVFPAMAALLIVIAALGYGAIAVRGFGAPLAGALLATGVIGFWPIALYLAWHPYWNQLWGFALLPYGILFAWRALADRDPRAAVLFVLIAVALGLAYPLALPYPLVFAVALAVAYWRRPRLPAWRGARAWIVAVVAALVLLPAIAGAALKLGQGIGQLLSPHSDLWGGDIHRFLPIGRFTGTGGGIVLALGVVAVAVAGLAALPRRPRWAIGVVLALLCLLDLRFRLAASGAYMDFKHLSFVGGLILVLAAVAICRLWLASSRAVLLAGAALAIAWTAGALIQDRRQGFRIAQQVPSSVFQIRDWAHQLPSGASVRVDIPPSGVQLWAVYMLASHPVDSPEPVLHTTYAYAPYGLRAAYSLSYRYHVGPSPVRRRYPVPPYAVNPPVFENHVFVLRRIAWPTARSGYPETASRRLVEP